MQKEFNIDEVRQDFPALSQKIHGKALVYFDNAATSQTPQQVLDVIQLSYREERANIHRAVHCLGQKATRGFENARVKVQKYINAPTPEQIIFTRGTTESINLVAYSYANRFLEKGDEILITEAEHHSNIVPWQLIAEGKGITIKVAPINDQGELIVEQFHALLNKKTKLVSFSHVSNSLGSINPVQEMIQSVRQKTEAKILLDVAQSIPHIKPDVQALDVDFLVFSGHKMLGPTGMGILYGKTDILNAMPPWQGGGDMIKKVTFEKSTYSPLPQKFEAGTPNIVGAIALGAAIDYWNALDFEGAIAHEHKVLEYALEKLAEIPQVRFIGEAKQRTSVISIIVLNGEQEINVTDLATLLDQFGIAVRTGHHCAQPVMAHFNIQGTLRISLAFYNDFFEIDTLIKALKTSINMLS